MGRRLRTLIQNDEFQAFVTETFTSARLALKEEFVSVMESAKKTDMRAFRVRYLLAKLTQHLDLQAYGSEGGQSALSHYVDGRNDVEHILPETPSPEALEEFGESEPDQDIIQRIGNLLLLEESVNRAIQNDAYSAKKNIYPSSQFLLTRCNAGPLPVGTNDRITRATRNIPNYKIWNRANIEARQKYLAKLSAKVWQVG